jgi:hypothetical protein
MSGAIGSFGIGVSPVGGTTVVTYTAQDIVNLALKSAGLLGVGQTALTEDINDTFSMLNGMLGQWNRKRWLIWHLIDVSFVSTGAQSYSVGLGGDFDIPRPDRLEDAYFRQIVSSTPNQIDYPLKVLQAREDYDKIDLKGLVSWPSCIFYDAASPMGWVYPWPIPQASNYELHLVVKDSINQFASLTTPVQLPPEYYEALWANLTLRLGAFYPGAVITDDLRGLAKASLDTIRNANAQVPRLRMPSALVRPPLYNIFSDSVY